MVPLIAHATHNIVLPCCKRRLCRCAGIACVAFFCLAAATLAQTPEAQQSPPSARHGKQPAPSTRPPLRLSLGKGVVLELVPIPAGWFWMGAPPDEAGRDEDAPRHRVRISRPFYLGRYEVTQAQWLAVMDRLPSFFTGDASLPVDSVRWEQAHEFCRRVSQQTGRTVRLPTEAQWEYACRAGTTTAFSFGPRLTPRDANFDWTDGGADGGVTLERTTPVGTFRPNAWGLYDMHGNVKEWCLDWYGRDYYRHSPSVDPRGPARGSQHVLRGGSWDDYARRCRSAYRGGHRPGDRDHTLGFRVCVEIPAEAATASATEGTAR